MFVHLLLLVVYFAFLWFSADLVIRSVEKLAKRFALSRFSMSLILLGPLTSLPELAVLINSVVLKSPQVSIGNLIGGQVIILFFIVPLLGILMGNVKLPSILQGRSLWLTLLLMAMPIITIADRHLHIIEGLILITLYAIFFITMYREASIGEKIRAKVHSATRMKGMGKDFLKIILGIVCVFLISNRIVVTVTTVAEILQLSKFFVSLMILSVGTNLPELSLAVLGVMNGKKDIALGNFVGSAALNTLLMGLLVVVMRGGLQLNGEVILTLPLFLVGIIIFSVFAKSHKTLSRAECGYLMLVYVFFIGLEVFREFVY